MYQSTILGTSVRPRAPPNALPFHTRPVTSWNGRVEISLPASATPITTETPQPRWHASSACRITSVLPVQSKVKSAPPSVSPTRCDDIAVELLRIDEMRHAEAAAPFFLGVIDIDADDSVGAAQFRALAHIEP